MGYTGMLGMLNVARRLYVVYACCSFQKLGAQEIKSCSEAFFEVFWVQGEDLHRRIITSAADKVLLVLW